MSKEELKAWRVRLGLKQRELAEIFGMSTRGYQDIEQGKSTVRPVYLLAMRSVEGDMSGLETHARVVELEAVLSACLDKMEFVWQEIDAEDGLCRRVGDVPDSKLWQEIVTARATLARSGS